MRVSMSKLKPALRRAYRTVKGARVEFPVHLRMAGGELTIVTTDQYLAYREIIDKGSSYEEWSLIFGMRELDKLSRSKSKVVELSTEGAHTEDMDVAPNDSFDDPEPVVDAVEKLIDFRWEDEWFEKDGKCTGFKISQVKHLGDINLIPQPKGYPEARVEGKKIRGIVTGMKPYAQV